VVAFLEQAVEFDRLLRTREVRFRAGLAARSGVSAMRVTQILALTKLAPEVQDFVRSLPPGTPERRVTERSLRDLTTMPPAEQLLHASRHVPGFGGFLVSRRAGRGPHRPRGSHESRGAAREPPVRHVGE